MFQKHCNYNLQNKLIDSHSWQHATIEFDSHSYQHAIIEYSSNLYQYSAIQHGSHLNQHSAIELGNHSITSFSLMFLKLKVSTLLLHLQILFCLFHIILCIILSSASFILIYYYFTLKWCH